VSELAKYITPVLKHSAPYLHNVAVFTKNHQCYLYFDKSAISKLLNGEILNDKDISEVATLGSSFKRYNSVRIDYQEHNGHIIIPVTIMGNDGIKDEMMLVDTGVSMTVIPLEVALSTDQKEDLNTVERKEFKTANGLLNCPTTKRTMVVGGIERKKTVAVFPEKNSSIGLLGVDFFSGMAYTIDSTSNAIYIWET
jgi:predicted aspartyl protease